MMIDGKLVGGKAGTFANINPATEEIIDRVRTFLRRGTHAVAEGGHDLVHRIDGDGAIEIKSLSYQAN
ncbi:hypothetical protein [Mycolicibacterium helvum]|uniref:Uncharacterized protein n=1 Tax=Mycolicibacterium helvum TaxID=1534349 RepID=A0A7I7TES0_9MYCO|nr:hypothetical protein [Mycolicibacterium helvum]BBY67724.1 hypothetical protein MHEL_59670 [Mycolicibacterium helvum]